MFKLCLGFYVDTLLCVKWLAKLSIFIHVDILVLFSEFVVVVILSEWWSVPTTVGTSLSYCDMCLLKYMYGTVQMQCPTRESSLRPCSCI